MKETVKEKYADLIEKLNKLDEQKPPEKLSIFKMEIIKRQLANQLIRIENYDPEKDYRFLFDMSMPDPCHDIYDDEGYHEICDFMYTTVDGVIEALKEIYFYPRKNIEDIRIRQYNELCKRTLQAHKLADFEIL